MLTCIKEKTNRFLTELQAGPGDSSLSETLHIYIIQAGPGDSSPSETLHIYIIQAGPGDGSPSETLHIHYTSRTWR